MRREYQNFQRIFQWEAGDKYLQNFLLKSVLAGRFSDQKLFACFVEFRTAIIAQNASDSAFEYFFKITNSVSHAELFLLLDKSYLPGASFQYSHSHGAVNQPKLLSALLAYIQHQKSVGKYKCSLDAVDVMLGVCLNLSGSELMEHIKAALSVDLKYALAATRKFINEHNSSRLKEVMEALDAFAQEDGLGFSLIPVKSELNEIVLVSMFGSLRSGYWPSYFTKLLLNNYQKTNNKDVGAQLLVILENMLFTFSSWRHVNIHEYNDLASVALPNLQTMRDEFARSEPHSLILERIERVVLELQEPSDEVT